MKAKSSSASKAFAAIPPDDPRRDLVLARSAADQALAHISVAGNVYTILLTGDDTGGRYCLLDMLILPGGGPPPHRHDFEEMFSILEGEIELTFRGNKSVARTGDTVNIPGNAPHSFRNTTNRPARMLCMCTPPGQELFFIEIGDPVASRIASPPRLSKAEQAARQKRAEEIAAQYRTELLKPDES